MINEFYNRLTAEDDATKEAIENLLASTVGRMNDARGRRTSNSFNGFLGAASGYLMPDRNAAGGYKEAIDARQLQEETDPLLDYSLMSRHYVDNRKTLGEMISKLAARINGTGEWKSDIKVVNGTVFKWDPNTQRSEVLYQDVTNSPLYIRAYEKHLSDASNDNLRFPDNESRLSYAAEMAQNTVEAALRHNSKFITKENDNQLVPYTPGKSTDTTESVKTPAPAHTDVDYSKQANLDENLAADDPENRLAALKHGIKVPFAHGTQEELGKKLQSKDVQPQLYTNEQVATQKEAGKLAASTVKTLQDQTSDLNKSNMALQDMENLTLAVDKRTGKLATPQGPAAELLKDIGGWVNYFAPNSLSALQAGNAGAFFSAMQTQVRSILPALGAGTAVSNMDLLVSQLSSGALENTVDGRLKIIGASKALNKAMSIINESKRQHIASGKPLSDWRMEDEPIVGLAPIKTQIDGTTYTRYEVLTKSDFINKLKAKYPKEFQTATKDEIDMEWSQFALRKGKYK